MRNTLKNLCTGLLMTGALLLYSADHAADIKDRTIKFAFVNYWGLEPRSCNHPLSTAGGSD